MTVIKKYLLTLFLFCAFIFNANAAEENKDAKPESDNTITVTSEQLLANVELLTRALYSSVIAENADAINVLLPIYEQVKDKDQMLYLKANALKQMADSKFGKASDSYYEILKLRPDFMMDRFKLAQNLYLNYRNIEAIEQLQMIRNQNNLSKADQDYIDAFIKRVKARDDASFDSSFTFIHDKNINQVTDESQVKLKNGGTITPPKRESATGISYSFDLNKKISRRYGTFITPGISHDGKLYFGKSEYNDVSLQFYLASGYKNAVFDFTVKPFYDIRWYDSERYVDKGGVNLLAGYRLTPKLKLSTYFEVSKKDYRDREDLNGNSLFGSASLFYALSNKMSFNTSVAKGYEGARDKSDQYNYHSLRVGVNINWTNTFNTYASYGVTEKKYNAPFAFFEKREDINEKLTLTLRDTRIEFKGFVPKLNISYEMNKSNNPIRNYNNFNAFISVEKLF